jgi:hypothetical protein
MKLNELIKTKMAAGLEHKFALESAISQLNNDAAQSGVKLTPEQLSEIGAAQQLLDSSSRRDPLSTKMASLVADVLPKLSKKLGAALQREIDGRMELAAAAGLDIRRATEAALEQLCQDLHLHDATPADLALMRSLRGRIDDAVVSLSL